MKNQTENTVIAEEFETVEQRPSNRTRFILDLDKERDRQLEANKKAMAALKQAFSREYDEDFHNEVVRHLLFKITSTERNIDTINEYFEIINSI